MPLTRLQKDRLLKEIKQEPGLSTTELAALISAPRRVVLSALCRLQQREEAASRLNNKHLRLWYPVQDQGQQSAKAPEQQSERQSSAPNNANPCVVGIDESDLAWMAHYRQRYEQRRQRARV